MPENQALHRLRSAQGVVGQADKHPAARLDAACRRAIEVGDPGYHTVKGILAAGTEHNGQPDPAVWVCSPDLAPLGRVVLVGFGPT